MSIIDQLEKTVTPAVLGVREDSDSVAYISLLEQFYAILASRLAVPQIYSQLLRTDQVTVSDHVAERTLLDKLWQDQGQQLIIIKELSATHHIDEAITTQLLMNAAPLAYRELKALANGQFLPAFLQQEQATLRPYLPMWAASIITATQDADHQAHPNAVMNDYSIPTPSLDKTDYSELNTGSTPIYAAEKNAEDSGIENQLASAKHQTESNELPNTYVSGDNVSDAKVSGVKISETNILAAEIPNDENEDFSESGAIHASPAAHHLAENSSIKREQVRTRNQRNDLLVRVCLLVIALAAMALAAWALLIKPSNEIPVEPVATAPAVLPPIPEPKATMTPIDFIIGVDNSGNLYTCSATVGDAALQGALQQAVNTSFGEQASICELAVQEGVATTIANMPVEMLPNVLTMLRSTPFARLQLQNDRMTLEAPDNMLLQQLVSNIRNLVPAMMIDSAAPLPLPNNSNGEVGYGTQGANEANNQLNGSVTNNNQYDNGSVNNSVGEFQAADDDTGDRVIPMPNNNRSNNTINNVPTNSPNNFTNNPANNPSNNTTNSVPPSNRSSGSISVAEADDMASSIFVAEPAQVR